MSSGHPIQAEAQQLTDAALAALLDCVPAFIIAIGLDGNIRFINQVLPQYTKEQVIGTHWLRYLAPHEHAEQRARLERVLGTGVTEHYETTVSGPNGESLCFSAHLGAMRLDNQVVGAILVSQDVTEFKRTQAEYAAAQRLAAIGTLAAGIAHEINTPIQFVSDSVHFLREASSEVLSLLERLTALERRVEAGAPDAEIRQELAGIAQAAEEADLNYLQQEVAPAFERCVDGLDRVAKIVRAMKDFAHPDETEMAVADLNKMVQSTLTIGRSAYKEVAKLETDLGSIPPVRCFVSDLSQVVLNLVVNASHAVGDVVQRTGELGTIRVTTRRDGDDVVIAVSDTGTGMSESVAQRIFEPFFTTKGVGQGTGQGLSMAWAVVKEKHGGELRFSTEVGKGTTFFVRIPIAGLNACDRDAA